MVSLGWNIILILLILLICFFRQAYSLYLFSVVSHGETFRMVENGFDGGLLIKHFSLILRHCPLLLLILNLYIRW